MLKSQNNYLNPTNDDWTMKIELAALGIGDGIWEVVATTRSREGVFNAAPIGLKCIGRDLSVSLFHPSKTLKNTLETGRIGVNILHDPLVFVEAATGDLDTSYFTKFENFPVIRDAEVWIIFEAELLEKGDAYCFDLSPLASKRFFNVPHPVNRGFNAVIEALILATRYLVVAESERKDLLSDIEHYERIVRKCGGDRDHEAMRTLRKYLKTLQS